VLHIVPVIDISLLIKLTLRLDTLDAGSALYSLPALGIVLHERLADTGVEITAWKLNVVGRLELAV
jgi:hypothetical protein